jgi:hypothetical protein
MSKQPLIFVEENGLRYRGSHSLNEGSPSPVVVPLLHFKFLSDCRGRVEKTIHENKLQYNMQEYKDLRDQNLSSISLLNQDSIPVRCEGDLHRFQTVISQIIEAGPDSPGVLRSVNDFIHR